MPIIGSLAGVSLGGLAGGGAAGGTAYVMTRNFLTGYKLEGNSLGEQDRLLANAKPIIALELMGGNSLSKDNWDKEIKKYYQSEFRSRISRILDAYGWIRIEVEYSN